MAETESLLSICCTTVNYKFKPLDDILAGKNVVLAEPDRILINNIIKRIQYRNKYLYFSYTTSCYPYFLIQ